MLKSQEPKLLLQEEVRPAISGQQMTSLKSKLVQCLFAKDSEFFKALFSLKLKLAQIMMICGSFN